MKTSKYILALVFTVWCALGNLYAINSTYYSSIDGKQDSGLREALTTLVYDKHTTGLSYDWVFDGIDWDSNGNVYDIYSDCGHKKTDETGSYKCCCDAINREHIVPQSTFGSKYPQYADRHHLYVVDGKVNGYRSDYAFGECSAGTKGTCSNSSTVKPSEGKATCTNHEYGKLGNSTFTEVQISGKVYEPEDEYKGDIARAIMYMVVRYATADKCKVKSGSGTSANAYPVTTWSTGNCGLMFSGSLSTNYGLSAYGKALLLKWHRNDPVSAKEIARNEGVAAKQGNRNPFIDYPCLAEYLWGNKTGQTVSLSELVGTFTGSWTTGDGCPCGTDPAITLPSTDIFVGATEASTPITKTITVQGVNLTSNLTLAVSGTNSSFFKLNATSILKASALTGTSVTITYTPTAAGNHTATLTISGGGLASNRTYTLTGTCCTPYNVTLSRNGITETVGACGTYTLPTAEEEADACDGWKFQGWLDSETSFTENQTADPASSYVTEVSSAKTLHAVYAKTPTGAPRRATMADTWTRVTSMETLTGGGTFIMGYEATAKSGTIIPLRSKDCNATTSANGYFNTGTTAGSSTSGTLDMTGTITSTDYEVYITSPASGKINIQQVNSSGSYYGATSGGSSKNSGRLYTSGSSNETKLTVEWDNESNNTFKLSAGVSGSYKYLKYNTGSPRFAFYNSAGGQVVFYKKSSGGSSATNYKKLPCSTYTITLSNDGSATGGTFEASASSATAGSTITLDADPNEGYELSGWTVTKAGSGTVTVTNNQFTMPEANVTVEATFTIVPKYNIRFFNNGTQIGSTQSVYKGSTPNVPADPVGCDDYTFVGWWTDPLAIDNTSAKTWKTDFTVTGAQDYHAVFSRTETGQGGGNTQKSIYLDEDSVSSSYGTDTEVTRCGVTCYYTNVMKSSTSTIQMKKNGSYIANKASLTKIDSIIINGVTTLTVYGGTSAKPETTTITRSNNKYDFSGGNYSYFKIKNGTSGALYPTNIKIYYTVSGGGSSSTTYYTSTTNCAAACTKLDPPSVKATPGNGQITLTWADVTGADHYTVTISSKGTGYTTECGSASTIGTITQPSSGSNQCIINGLTNGLAYTTNVVANASSSTCDSDADEDTATPQDCTPWDDPSLSWNQYSLNTSDNKTATKTLTGTTHGTLSFESSNTEVLTVDGSTGAVTAVGAGEATVTAHWPSADGFCEKTMTSSTFVVAGPLTISFDANGGTGTMTDQTVTYKVAEAIKTNAFTRTGYTFQGWALTADGEKTYDDKQSVAFTNSVTLYAVWQVNSHNVTFTPSPTGATVTINGQSTNPQSAEYGSTVTIAITPADHYTISSVTATGETSHSSLTLTGTGDTRTFTMPDENVKVAVSLGAETQYTATFKNNTATVATVTGYVDDDIAAPATAPESCDDDEFTFVGWVTSEQTTESTSHPDILNFPQTMPTGGVTYYALFRHSEGGTGGNAGVTFKTANEDGTSPYTSDSDIKANLVDTYTGIASFAGNKLYKGEKGVKLGSSKGNGYITVELSPAITTDKITVVASKYGTDGGKLQVEVNGDTEFGEALSPADGTLEFTGTATEISSLTVSTTSNRAYIASISLGGGGTSYYTTAPTCAPCEYKVTLTKGAESHGTFTLSQDNGNYDNCKKNFSLTVSAIKPDDGYYCTGVTATGSSKFVAVSGPDGSGNYTVAYAKGNSITSTVTANFEPIPTYTVIWSIDGDENDTEQYAEGAEINFSHVTPSCDGKVFTGWSAVEVDFTDDEPTYVTSATMGTSELIYYAVFATPSGSAPARRMTAESPVNDVLTLSTTGVSGTSYVDWEDVTVTSSAVYAGNSAGGNSSIQLRSNNSNSGIVTTTSGGKAKKVAVVWNSNTTSDRKIDIYGKNSAYSDAGDLYTNSTQGTKIGSITYGTSTELTISDDYEYIGIRSNSGALYLTSVTITWSTDGSAGGDTGGGDSGGGDTGGGSSAYTGYSTSCTPPSTVKVIFNANFGETPETKEQTIPYNTATALSANTFTRTGYAFDGWATSADGEKVYNDLESVTLMRRTTYLYARWKKNSYNININSLSGGEITTSPAKKAEFEEVVTVVVTPDASHQFESLTVKNDKTGETLVLTGSGATQTFTMPASSVTITATVAIIPTYTVSWSADGIIETEQYREGQDIVFPATADGCEDKVFVGWCASKVEPATDEQPTLVSAATMGTSALTYYAVYATATAGAAGKYTLDYADEDLTNTSGWGAYGKSLTYTASDGGVWIIKAYKNTGMQINTGKDCSIKIPSCSGNITSIEVTCSAAKAVGFSIANYSGSGTITYEVTGSDATSQTLDFTGKELKDGYIVPKSGSTVITKIVVNYGTNTYKGYTTSCGASINAKNNTWVTAANGQTVKALIPVVAKAFDEAVTLSAVSDNAHFVVSLAQTAVPATAAGLTTTLTVEYTPVAANTTETATITLTAGDKTKEITVSGRSLPDQFLLITKKYSDWYALPANMSNGTNQYDGVEVTPDDGTAPTSVPISPSTIVYSLKAVASGRYATAGNCVRLVGNNSLCLWANNTAGAVGIKNSEKLADSNGSNNEWLLTTTDGVRYTIANPAHPDYAAGRTLAYGMKFGLYVQETEFYIVSTGCNTLPQNVHVSPRREDATFSWSSSAEVMHIAVYSDQAMSALVTSADATASPYFLEGLSEQANYWYKLTPDDDTECAKTGSFSTSGPTIDVVEWGDDKVTILVDKDPDLDPTLTITGVIEHGLGDEGVEATELFFSKYFEGAGDMKLLAIYNGTPNDIPLTNYEIFKYNYNSSNEHKNNTNDKTFELRGLGTIKAGQEIVLFSRPSNSDDQADLTSCSGAFLDSVVALNSTDLSVRWIECNNSKTYGGVKFPSVDFSGNDPVYLYKSDEVIDVIGADNAPGISDKNCRNEPAWLGTIQNMDYRKSPSDPAFNAFYEASSKSPVSRLDSVNLLTAFGINLEDSIINATTARCILFRYKMVTSGENAVTSNATTFGSFTSDEWRGRNVCMTTADRTAAGVTGDGAATCNSYQDLGNFDYSEYYTESTTLGDESHLSDYLIEGTDKDNEGLYEIPVDGLNQFSCLNLVFKLENDGGDVLTEKEVKVPIIIKDEKTTVDPIFNEIVKKDNGDPLYTQSINRCKECEVLVLGTGKLTKAADNATHDVAQLDKLTLYPGSKLIVPPGTNFTVNDMTYLVDGDDVPISELNGNLMTNNERLFVTRRLTNDRYYFFSLPYDCNLSDVTLSSGKNVVNGIDYRLLEYDSDARAQEGSLVGTPGHWKLAEGVIKAGTGYVIAVPTSNPRELVFPMALEDRNLTNLERTKQTNRVPIEEYVSSQTRENNHNWNLIAHPYLTIFDVSNPGVTIEDAWENPTRPDSTWVKIFDPDYRPDSTGTQPIDDPTQPENILAQGTVADGAAWTLLIDGAMTIEGEGEIPSYSATASMPWYEYKDKIVNLTIKGNVTKIGDYAFYLCSALNSVTIIAPVTYIGDNAFYGCTGLANFTIATDQCISVTSTTFTNVELSNINLIVPQSQVNCYRNTTNGVWSKMNITITADGTTSGAPQRMQPRRMRMDEGDWEPSPGGIYITVPQVGGDGKTITYEQRWIKDLDNIPPFVSVFVQGDGKGEMTFNLYPETPAPARRLMARNSKTTEDGTIFVGVTLSGNGEKDLASLRLRPDFPDKYKLGLDLLKFTTFYTPRPQIYMKTPDYKLAFRAINDDYAAKYWMPMGVYCRDAGKYTFSLYDRYPLDEVEGVYLFDIETGAVTNLLLGNYTIETTKQLYTEKRFYVNVRLRREVVVDTPTYIEPVDDPNAPHKFIRDGVMYIMRDGRIYDLTGKPAFDNNQLLNR